MLSAKFSSAFISAGDRRGSGFLAQPEWVFTCEHVIRAVGLRGRVKVRFEGLDEITATVENIDAENDCALLKLDRSVTEIKPLKLATERPAKGARWESSGYPKEHTDSQLLIAGEIQDPEGQDRRRKPSLQLFSQNLTAGSIANGLSGSAVVAGDTVVGLLKSVIADQDGGSEFGVVFACPSRFLSAMLPMQTELPNPPPPGAAYDERVYLLRGLTERRALRALNAQGRPVLLWGPDLSGKTWSLSRIAADWKKQVGGRVLRINIDLFGRADTATAPLFLSRLARDCARQLKKPLPSQFRADDVLSASDQFADVMTDWLADGPLLLCLDRADSLLSYDYCDDFFALLRGWSELGYDPWDKLRLLLAVSTTPKDLTRTGNVSPLFNISEAIEIEPLKLADVRTLSYQYSLVWSDQDLAALLDWIGGQPFLLRVLFNEASLLEKGLAGLQSEPPEELLSLLRHIGKRVELLGLQPALQKVGSAGTRGLDIQSFERLRRLGLVRKSNDGSFQLACQLFRELL